MRKYLAYALTLSFVTLSSCHKDKPAAPLPLSDLNIPNREIAVNLTYSDNTDSLKKDLWELIISEPAGKLLLDTVAPVNTAISAILHTNVYVVDLTYVAYSAQYNDYYTVTYRNVNPGTWKGFPYPGSIEIGGVDQQSTTVATVNYIHPPNLANLNDPNISSIMISDYVYAFGIQNLNYQPGYSAYQPGGLLTANYFRYGNGPVYTLLPQLGLYNFHQPPATGNDTVDLTHMDTVAMVTYPVPAGFTKESCTLYGFTDTTNMDKSMTLSFNLYNLDLPADVEYPPTGVQTYEFFLGTFNTATNEYLTYSSYGPHVAPSINWFNSADYSVHANLQDSISIGFGSAKPTFYRVDLQSGNNYFQIYSPADGATLHPYTWFTHLGSKLLQGQSLSALAPYYIYFEQENGLAIDYNGVMSFYATSPSPTKFPAGAAVTTYQTPI
jgi:hypothetical protein